jgi:hypothetical protein
MRNVRSHVSVKCERLGFAGTGRDEDVVFRAPLKGGPGAVLPSYGSYFIQRGNACVWGAHFHARTVRVWSE